MSLAPRLPGFRHGYLDSGLLFGRSLRRRVERSRVGRAWTIAWFGGAIVGIVNGATRELVYRDRVGELTAHQISTAVALALFAAYFAALQARWPLPSRRVAMQVGALWVALTLAFEFGFGHWVDHKSWDELLQQYDVSAGYVWAFVLTWSDSARWWSASWTSGCAGIDMTPDTALSGRRRAIVIRRRARERHRRTGRGLRPHERRRGDGLRGGLVARPVPRLHAPGGVSLRRDRWRHARRERAGGRQPALRAPRRGGDGRLVLSAWLVIETVVIGYRGPIQIFFLIACGASGIALAHYGRAAPSPGAAA